MNENEKGGFFDGIIEETSVNQVDTPVVSNNSSEVIGFDMPNNIEPIVENNVNNIPVVPSPVIESGISSEVIGFEQSVVVEPVSVEPTYTPVYEPVYGEPVVSENHYAQNNVDSFSIPSYNQPVVADAQEMIDYGRVENPIVNSNIDSEIVDFYNAPVPQIDNNAAASPNYNSFDVNQSIVDNSTNETGDFGIPNYTDSVVVEPVSVEPTYTPVYEPVYEEPIVSENSYVPNNVDVVSADNYSTPEIIENPSYENNVIQEQVGNNGLGFNYDFNFENQIKHVDEQPAQIMDNVEPVVQQNVGFDTNILMPEMSANEAINFEQSVAVESTPDLISDVQVNNNINPEVIGTLDNNADSDETEEGATQIIDTQLIQENVGATTVTVDSDQNIINSNIIVNPIIEDLQNSPELLTMPVEEPRVNYEKIANKNKMIFLGIFFGFMLIFIIFLPKIVALFS